MKNQIPTIEGIIHNDDGTIAVSMEYIKRIMEMRKEINNLDLRKVTIWFNGVEIPIPEMAVSEFQLTGLSNMDFFRSIFDFVSLLDLLEVTEEK